MNGKLFRSASQQTVPGAYSEIGADVYRRSDGDLHVVGTSAPFLSSLKQLATFAEFPAVPLMILGESGAGKEVAALVVRYLSETRDPYVAVNCGAIPDENMAISELFGHTKGAFTGAVNARAGAFTEASGGILFLDEVAELSPSVQVMLLRALSVGEIRPLGATSVSRVDVRLICATNRNLTQMVDDGEFREDLYYRLNPCTIQLPPLRDRQADWLSLWNRFQVERRTDGRTETIFGEHLRFDRATQQLLTAYEWPGNVRSLYALFIRLAMDRTRGTRSHLITRGDVERHLAPFETERVSTIGTAGSTADPHSPDAIAAECWRRIDAGETFNATFKRAYKDKDLCWWHLEQALTRAKQLAMERHGNSRWRDGIRRIWNLPEAEADPTRKWFSSNGRGGKL